MNEETTVETTESGQDGYEEEQDVHADDASGSAEDDQQEWVAPTREEHQRMMSTIQRQKEKEKTLRRENGALKQQLVAKSGGKEEKVDEQAAELERWRTNAAKASAATALQAAGFSGSAKAARRLTRLLDLAASEPDQDGYFDFDDEIDELREEFPQLFQQNNPATNGRPVVRKVTTSDRGGRSDESPSMDKTTRRLMEQGGYFRRAG